MLNSRLLSVLASAAFAMTTVPALCSTPTLAQPKSEIYAGVGSFTLTVKNNYHYVTTVVINSVGYTVAGNGSVSVPIDGGSAAVTAKSCDGAKYWPTVTYTVQQDMTVTLNP